MMFVSLNKSILCSQCYLLLSKLFQGQTLGDETKKNCTTVFYSIPKNYSDIYFFRLECLNRIKFTFLNGVYIIIQPGMSCSRHSDLWFFGVFFSDLPWLKKRKRKRFVVLCLLLFTRFPFSCCCNCCNSFKTARETKETRLKAQPVGNSP